MLEGPTAAVLSQGSLLWELLQPRPCMKGCMVVTHLKTYWTFDHPVIFNDLSRLPHSTRKNQKPNPSVPGTNYSSSFRKKTSFENTRGFWSIGDILFFFIPSSNTRSLGIRSIFLISKIPNWMKCFNFFHSLQNLTTRLVFSPSLTAALVFSAIRHRNRNNTVSSKPIVRE